MKTNHSTVPVDSSSPGTVNDSPLAPLLSRISTAGQLNTASTINGLLLGVFHSFSPEGMPLVQLPQCGAKLLPARSATQLLEQDIGRQVVLGFENGDIQSPIVLGLMHQFPNAPQLHSTRPLQVEHHGERTVIEAEQELELRCGDAVILLQADGRIQLRGEYITSHANAGQRIRGGSVQIN